MILKVCSWKAYLYYNRSYAPFTFVSAGSLALLLDKQGARHAACEENSMSNSANSLDFIATTRSAPAVSSTNLVVAILRLIFGQ